MQRAEADLLAWESKKMHRSSLRPLELLEKLFPMVVSTGRTGELRFMVWNSVWVNRWPWNNAMGEIDDTQLQRAEQVLRNLGPSVPIVHLLHHQIGVPNSRPVYVDRSEHWFRRIFAVGMGLKNAPDLMKWIAKRRQQTVVLHGHRHKYFIAEDTEYAVTVVSAPSASKSVEMSFDERVRAGLPGRWLRVELDVRGPHVALTGATAVAVGPAIASA
jgi:hypothetical protein